MPRDCAQNQPFRMLICPDHPTPIAVRTHVSDPIPYLLYSSEEERGCGAQTYDEDSAAQTGIYIERGCDLMRKLIG